MGRISSLILALSLQAAYGADLCGDRVYAGFDTRLVVSPLGTIANPKDLVGFEIVRERVIAAYTQEVRIVAPGLETAIQSQDAIVSLFVDSEQRVRIATAASGMQRLTAQGLVNEPEYPKALLSLLHNSGGPVPIVADEHNGVTSFALLRALQHVLPIARVAGPMRTAGWNEEGLAAVVGQSLVTWRSGSKELQAIAMGSTLERARDVTLIGEGRAVVALDSSVVLFSPSRQLVIVGVAAKCRYSGRKLYLLDQHTGVVWSIEGLDQLGDRAGDERHARDLLAKVKTANRSQSTEFLEAVRILGCSGALK
jgi:hypothetical protein